MKSDAVRLLGVDVELVDFADDEEDAGRIEDALMPSGSAGAAVLDQKSDGAIWAMAAVAE